MTPNTDTGLLARRFKFVLAALIDERRRLLERGQAAELDAQRATIEKARLRDHILRRSPTTEVREELLAQYAGEFAALDAQIREPDAIKERLAQLGPLIEQARRNRDRHAPPTPNPWQR